MNNYTIKDIARLSGVGVSTVSRVINNYPGVNSTTRAKILEVIEQCNYIPNSNAKSLKQLNSQIIGIIVKGMLNPFFTGIIVELQHNIEKAGYVPFVNYIDELDDEILSAKQFLSEKKGAGIIFLGGSATNREEELELFNKPCVFATSVAKNCNIPNVSSVSIDDRQASRLAINKLISCNHKDILVIGGAMLSNTDLVHDRYLGIVDAFKENDMKFNKDDMYKETKFSYEYSYSVMDKCIKSGKHFTAVFAMSDIIAIGAVKCITDNGLSVPRDISIIGFDGIDIGQYYNPTLTTIRQPYQKIASNAVNILVKSIRNKNYSEHMLLDGELIEGKSVCLNKELN